MRKLVLTLVALWLMVLCNASGLQPPVWSSDTSDSSEGSGDEAGSSSRPDASRSGPLWKSKASMRLSMENFRREAALEEASGLRKLITQDGLLSLRSPNFVIWLQNKGRKALQEDSRTAEKDLKTLMENRIRWVDLTETRKPLLKKYRAAIRKDLIRHAGKSSLSTILLKTRLRLLDHAGDAPTEFEAQIFRLTENQARTALMLVDKFEQHASDAGAHAH